MVYIATFFLLVLGRSSYLAQNCACTRVVLHTGVTGFLVTDCTHVDVDSLPRKCSYFRKAFLEYLYIKF